MKGFLGTIERVGNKVPHPAILFLALIGILIVRKMANPKF